MDKRTILKDLLALAVLVGILVGTPLLVWWYEHKYIPSTYPAGSHIVDLTAMAPRHSCIWTLERIAGYNYWWKKFKFAKEIPINEGEKVIFRVKSSDVLHSFAIPRFRIGPYEVDAGKMKVVEFDANRAGGFKYLCWLWCSDCHPDLKGKIIVAKIGED